MQASKGTRAWLRDPFHLIRSIPVHIANALRMKQRAFYSKPSLDRNDGHLSTGGESLGHAGVKSSVDTTLQRRAVKLVAPRYAACCR